MSNAPQVNGKLKWPKRDLNGRTLVVCLDGTANEFDDTNTNVVKLFGCLEKNSPKQVVYYQSFVGPLAKAAAKKIDEGVAWYMGEHVIGAYTFIMDNYEEGDAICLFGFSRGAYTARALAGMLYSVGLLPRSMTEQVSNAYRLYKNGNSVDCRRYKRLFSRSQEVLIEFLGVWDTVASVGAIVPRVLPFSSSNYTTKTFRHAISLDEHRAKFRSNPWHYDPVSKKEEGDDDTAKNQDEEASKRPFTDVKEVYFSGCHCDVGGGNHKDSAESDISHIPLRWMIKEIVLADAGIIFKPEELEEYHISLPSNFSAHKALQPAIEHGDANESFSGTEENGETAPLISRSSISPYLRDIACPIRDELVKNPFWWLLEILPFKDHLDGSWLGGYRINFFRPRTIPVPSVPEGEPLPPVLFHVSVRDRMKSPEAYTYSWWTLWLKRNVPYRPRAWPSWGEPEFVE